MGLFEHWPYVNFHDLNLDWIIKEIPKVFASRDEAQASAEASAESAAASQLSADAALASQEAAHQSELNAAQSKENAAESEQNAAETVSNTINQINLLQGRVDNIIPSGTQTEGNTELIDIRVGYNGVIYDSAGNAVRTQVQNVNDIIDQITEQTTGKNILPPELTNGYINASGDIVIYSDWKTTEYVDISEYEKVIFSAANTNDTRIPVALNFITTYDENKTRIEQLDAYSNSVYTRQEGVYFIRFSIHTDQFHDYMLESGDAITSYEPYHKIYTPVNNSYALNADLESAEKDIEALQDQVNVTTEKEYDEYNPDYSLSPSAIWDNGVLINTLQNASTTDYIDCSSWLGIKYTGKSYLGARAIAFYDENHAWISSLPATGETTEYINEIITIPVNAKYVIFADLSHLITQTIKIEISTSYKLKGKWTGKKWVAFGDSLTEVNSRATKRYHDYVAEVTGIEVVNMGRSGTGYKRTYDEGYAFYQRILNVPTDADVVTIFGSGNDMLYGADLGTPSDTFDETDPGSNTLCACINKTIDNLYSVLPTVQLGIVTPCPWIGYNPSVTNNSMALYSEAIVEICRLRGIKCLDLYHCSELRPWDSTYRQLVYSRDDGNGVHPNELGHKILAPHFNSLLETLVI